MSLRLYGTISGCGKAAGVVIPSLGSGRYAPGPNIVSPSWLEGEDPNYTINTGWEQPGILAIVSCHDDPLDDPRSCCLVKEFVQGEKNLEASVRSLEDDKSFFEFLDSCLVHSWGQKALLCECWYHAAVS